VGCTWSMTSRDAEAHRYRQQAAARGWPGASIVEKQVPRRWRRLQRSIARFPDRSRRK
jgi:hypothetical protein